MVNLGPRPRVALLLTAGLPLVIALALVQGYRSAPHGYVAGYWFLPAIALGAIGTLGALPLLFFRDVRWIGVLVVASSLSLPIIFVIGANVAGSLGLIPWQNQKMIPMGPDITSDLVIVFKQGVTRDQIQEFHDTVLGVPHPSGRGIGLLPGLCSYLSILSSQTKHGLDSVALSYCVDAPIELRQSIKETIIRSELVHGMYEDTSPVELQLHADNGEL